MISEYFSIFDQAFLRKEKYHFYNKRKRIRKHNKAKFENKVSVNLRKVFFFSKLSYF